MANHTPGTTEEQPELTDTQQFWLGIARADTDVEEQSAAVRIAQDTGKISSREASDKLVLIRENHFREVKRLRDWLVARKAARP